MALTKAQIKKSLQEMGLKKGDIVLLHSSYISMGPVQGGPKAVVDAFLEVLGKEGTFLVPVFGALGVITDEVKSRKNAVISSAPVGTLAAIGKNAEKLLKDHWKADTAHGKDTPFTRIADMDGYICLLGVDQDRNTTLHGVEALLELPYLRETTATFKTPEGKSVTKTWKYYPGPHRDFIGLDKYLAGLSKMGRIGNAQVRLTPAADLFEVCLAIGREEPAFVLCDNPSCMDCVKQRAAIFRARMAKESFTLSASSRLAGRFIPEMVENLTRIGIENIEIDYIQGLPWFKYSENRLAAFRAELEEGGISISALRLFTIPEGLAPVIAGAKAMQVKELILPLNTPEEVLKTLEKEKLSISFFNTNESAAAASGLVKGLNGRFVFNSANFVTAGEKPFLMSYRIGRFIKTTIQLDIVDRTWEGEETVLAGGNGEIKELISIFRCRNFDGTFTLGGGVIYPGSLEEAAGDFIRLLDNM